MSLRAALPPRSAGRHSRASQASWVRLGGVCLVLLAPLPAVRARAGAIAGYATEESIVQGGTLELHVATEAPAYDVVIEDALDPGLVLATLPNLSGQACPTPDSTFAWGCSWPVGATIPISTAWPSGVYYARLVSHAYGPTLPDTSFVPFVVR